MTQAAVHEALTWNGEVRHLVLHANGEEWLLMEPVEENRIRGCWITDIGRESLLAMGWSRIEAPMPRPMQAMADRLLAEDRERPSDILAGLMR